MRMVLFDLGQTLEDHDVLLPGALQALEDMSTWRDADGNPVLLALGWGFDAPAQHSYDVIESLGIHSFFESASARVTLSGEVGCTSRRRSSSKQRWRRQMPG